MPSIELSPDLYQRYERLASEFDDFDDEHALLTYILTQTADELEQGDTTGQRTGVENEAVEDRLEQLGYIE